MRKIHFILFLFFLAFGAWSCASKNETTEENTSTEQFDAPDTESSENQLPKISLSEKNAESYAVFMEKLRTKAPDWEKKMNDNPVSALATVFTANAELESLVKESGFESKEEFYAVVTRYSQVLISLQNNKVNADMQSGKDKAMADFDKQLANPALDENTKKMLLEQREQIKKSLDEYEKTSKALAGDVTDEERKIAEKYLPRISGNKE